MTLIDTSVSASGSGLSFGQLRLLFLDELSPGSVEYLVPVCVRLRGSVSWDAVRHACWSVVGRHEVLRSTFGLGAGDEPSVSVGEAQESVDLQYVDWSDCDVEEVQRLLSELALQPMDLASGPLVRVTLARVGVAEHVLLFVVHHIVIDAWSWDNFAAEFSEFYRAYVDGDEPVVAPLAIQYRDFAQWQRETLLAERAVDDQLRYWRQHLADMEVLCLPTDHRRPDVRSGRGDSYGFALPDELTERLLAVFRSHRVSPFMGLLALFQLLLARSANQSDISVGVPISGRVRSELEPLIGFFLNTLVIRTDLGGELTGTQLLSRVREQALNAYANSELPFERLVEAIAPERDLSRSPLFQAMFIYNQEDTHRWSLPGLHAEQFELPIQVCWVDITFSVIQRDGVLRCAFEYSTDLFDVGTITELANRFCRLVESFVADPDRLLRDIDMLDASAYDDLVALGQGPRTDYGTTTIVELIDQQVLTDGERTAVRFGDQHLSYRELTERASTLAAYLSTEHHIGPDVVVGICMDRSLELIVSLLAVLKAGGAYLPLDPDYPTDRLRFMLDDTAAAVVLTTDSRRSRIPHGHGRHLISLDADWDQIRTTTSTSAFTFTFTPPQPDHLAYVVYTSGSTGQPKGVQIEHTAALNVCNHFARVLEVSAAATVLALTAVTFDIAVLELLMPLTVGATIALAPTGVARDERALAELLDDVTPDLIQATPSGWRFLLGAGSDAALAAATALCGGEALDSELATQLNTACAELINVYGPSETTVWSTAGWVDGAVGIGRPIGNTDVFVVDCFGGLAPAGVAGELWIGGAGVARGYVNRAELTAQRFVRHALGGAAGRAYRTGDLVRWRADGELEFLGRIDGQVKIRGYRVEPGEVESVLGTHPDVAAAVVVAVTDGPGDVRLVGYCVLNPEVSVPTVDAVALRAWCARSLPEYMVPSAVMVLEAFPLTGNGKVDRKALPAPVWTDRGDKDHYAAPRTAVELALTDIWQSVLGVERIGIDDDFFTLGGDSIAALTTVRRANACGIGLATRDLFRHSDIRSLADRVGAPEGLAASGENDATSTLVVDDATRNIVANLFVRTDDPNSEANAR